MEQNENIPSCRMKKIKQREKNKDGVFKSISVDGERRESKKKNIKGNS